MQLRIMKNLTSDFIRGVITSSPHGIFACDVADSVIGAQLRQTGASGLDSLN
jgi:hypothetical protein